MLASCLVLLSDPENGMDGYEFRWSKQLYIPENKLFIVSELIGVWTSSIVWYSKN
jgi:hypothetical protein